MDTQLTAQLVRPYSCCYAQLLVGAGKGVPQLGLQLLLVGLLVGAGDALLGLQPDFVAGSVRVSLACILLSAVVLGVSYLSSQALNSHMAFLAENAF